MPSPTLAVSDSLPRTMARIRRLVRENPNDRELQRLLHTLLTSMSSDRIDEAEVNGVLAQMEQRKNARSRDSLNPLSPPLTLAVAQLVTPAAVADAPPSRSKHAASPERSAALSSRLQTPASRMRTPAPAGRPSEEPESAGAIARAAHAIAVAERQQKEYAELFGDGSVTPLAHGGGGASVSSSRPTRVPFSELAAASNETEAAEEAEAAEEVEAALVPARAEAPNAARSLPHQCNGPPEHGGSISSLAPPGAPLALEPVAALAGGYWSHERHEHHLDAMRRRHEEALSALRQKTFRDARQAQAHHEYALAQVRRQGEEQLGAASDAKRAEARRADGLASKLAEAQVSGLPSPCSLGPPSSSSLGRPSWPSLGLRAGGGAGEAGEARGGAPPTATPLPLSVSYSSVLYTGEAEAARGGARGRSGRGGESRRRWHVAASA